MTDAPKSIGKVDPVSDAVSEHIWTACLAAWFGVALTQACTRNDITSWLLAVATAAILVAQIALAVWCSKTRWSIAYLRGCRDGFKTADAAWRVAMDDSEGGDHET